jgi:two-component system LytT family response regulator
VLIAEDEPAARAMLRSMLEAMPEVEVAGEAGDGGSAVRAIAAMRPDLVLLDVKMPELDGFGVVEAVGVERMPAVVFVTAFDQYALQAFEVHAADYLLKPFDADRLKRSVRRVLGQMETGDAAALRRRLDELLKHLRGGETGRLERIPVRADGRVRFVDVADLDWIEADDHDLRLHVGKSVHVIRETLARMEARLAHPTFIRVHRSIIVNTRRIQEVQPWFDRDYVLILKDGTRITTGRGFRDNIRRLLELGEPA